MSPQPPQSDELLDARGLRCPVPVLRTRDRLKALPNGAVLEVLGDDPLILLDMQAFCAQEGHEYLGQRDESGGGWRISVRKAGG